MKQLSILFAFLFLFTPLFVGAQNDDEINAKDLEKETASLFRPARVFESDESMSQGIQNAIVVELISKDGKLVENVWKDFMKDFGGKTKKSKGGKNEFTTTGAEMVAINGVKPLTIYSKTSDGAGGNMEMMVWFDMGDEYLESVHKSQFVEAESMLQKFAHEVKIESTKEELKEAEKKLRNIEGDLKQLERQNEGYHKDIENYEKKIIQAKEDIVTNEVQQEDTAQKIDLQKMLIEEIDRRLGDLKKQD